MRNYHGRFPPPVVVLLLGMMAGCASNSPAPVSERTPLSERNLSPAVEKLPVPGEVDVKPGYYLVKKGDTLRSIALDHGQDYKEVASWNSLDNPNLIKIGQILRVVPLENEGNVAETHAVSPPIQIESRAIDSKPLVATEAAVVKREPKGGTQIYSSETWAQMQKPAPLAPAQTPPIPAKSGDVTTKEAAIKPLAATEIEWSWPSSNKVTSPFSEGSNKGLDFNGSVGEPVLAAAAGKVTLVTNSLRGYGNLIVVKHNATYLSVYAHNNKMLVSEGQSVSRGQKIAEIGSTDTDRPNLHFEIRREGKPVDPSKFLPQR